MTLVISIVIVLLVIFGKQIFAWIRSSFAGLIGPGGLGIGDQVTQKNNDSAEYIGNYQHSRNSSGPFSPSLYTNNPDASTMTFAQLVDVCNQITSASVGTLARLFGKVDGDEDQMVNAFKNNCQNQIDVSNLSIVFKQETGVDLLDYIGGTGDGFGTGFISLANIDKTADLLKWISNLPIQ